MQSSITPAISIAAAEPCHGGRRQSSSGCRIKLSRGDELFAVDTIFKPHDEASGGDAEQLLCCLADLSEWEMIFLADWQEMSNE